MDFLLVLTLLISFAACVTLHLWIGGSLLLRQPRWYGVVGLLLPPLLPVLGWQAGFRVRSTLWTALLLVYLVSLLASGI